MRGPGACLTPNSRAQVTALHEITLPAFLKVVGFAGIQHSGLFDCTL
jgi:hypothetical protein